MLIQKIKVMSNHLIRNKDRKDIFFAKQCKNIIHTAIGKPIHQTVDRLSPVVGKVVKCWYHYGKIYLDIDFTDDFKDNVKMHYAHNKYIIPAIRGEFSDGAGNKPSSFLYFFISTEENTIFDKLTKVKLK